jgi:hypothetical protein
VLSDGLVKVQLLLGKVTLVCFVHHRGHCGACWRENFAAVSALFLSVGWATIFYFFNQLSAL